MRERIGKFHDIAAAPIVLSHFNETAARSLRQKTHILRVGTPEFKDILVIVTNRYQSQFLIAVHKRLHEFKLLPAHILSLVNDKDRFRYPGWLDFPVKNHSSCPGNHIIGIIKVPHTPDNVKGIGMESLDFHKHSRIANQLCKPLLEFRGSRPGKSQHKELLVLHILKHQYGRKLMHKHPRLSAARSGGYYDTAGFLVIDDFHLSRRKLPEELVVFGRRQIAFDFLDTLTLEVLGYEFPVIHPEVVADVGESGIVVLHHKVCVLPDNVDLLDFLSVELIQHLVVIFLVLELGILYTADIHSIVYHEESAFYFQRSNF